MLYMLLFTHEESLASFIGQSSLLDGEHCDTLSGLLARRRLMARERDVLQGVLKGGVTIHAGAELEHE